MFSLQQQHYTNHQIIIMVQFKGYLKLHNITRHWHIVFYAQKCTLSLASMYKINVMCEGQSLCSPGHALHKVLYRKICFFTGELYKFKFYQTLHRKKYIYFIIPLTGNN